MAGTFECIAAMEKVLGRKLKDEGDEAEIFIAELARAQNHLGALGLANDPLAAARAVVEKQQLEKAVAQRNLMMNRRAWVNGLIRNEPIADKSMAMTAMRVGVHTPIEGGRLSVDAQAKAMVGESWGGLISDLRKLGGNDRDLVSYFLGGKNELPIARALAGETKDVPPEAKLVADTITKYTEANRARENRAGGFRGFLEGRVRRMDHNPELIKKAGFERWREKVMQWLDPQTFKRDADTIAALQFERSQIEAQHNEAKLSLAAIRDTLSGERRPVQRKGETKLERDGGLTKEARQAEGRSETADAREIIVESQLGEARRSTGLSLERYMNLAERERTVRDALPIDPNADPRQVAAERTQAHATAVERAATLRGQADEAHKATQSALRRYMELADRERGARGIDGGPVGVIDDNLAKRTARDRAEAGVRYHDAVRRQGELRDQLSAAEHDAALKSIELARVRSPAAAARRLGELRGEARVALTEARDRLNQLHDRHSGAKYDAATKRDVAERLRTRVAAELAQLKRTETALDLFTETGDKLEQLQGRLRAGVSDPDAYLRDIYNKITANQWTSHQPGFDGLFQYMGPGNAAKRRAAHRELLWNDAEAELAYSREFGRGSLVEGIQNGFEHDARTIALMEWMGPNYEANHKKMMDHYIAEATKRNDYAEIERLNSRAHDDQMAEITGATRNVVNVRGAMWSSAIRATINMTKLGMAMISSFTDQATAAASLSRFGVNPLEARWKMIGAPIKGMFRKAETRQFLDLIDVGTDYMKGSIAGRFSSNDGLLGKWAKTQHLFFKLNLVNYWTDAMKSEVGITMARHYAQRVGKAYDALDEWTQTGLKKYGIDAASWDILRTSGVENVDGKQFVTPHGVRVAPLGDFLPLFKDVGPPTERQLIEARDRLVTKYGALLNERSNFGVPTPTAAESAIMNMGTARGTVPGEALRFLMQFKGFPIAQMHKTMGETLYGNTGKVTPGSLARMAALMVEMTAWGYIAMSVKDMLKGREPRDPRDVETILASGLQGGGLGLYGDFLFGENNRFGKSFGMSILPPAVGVVSDFAGLVAKALRVGEEKGDTKPRDLAATAMRTVINNTPFINLFYSRMALDYFFLWSWAETMNPGWARRFEARIKRENKQDFWSFMGMSMRPTEVVR